MNRKLIRKVAKAHKTTVKDVREQPSRAGFAHPKGRLKSKNVI
jgi:hypothetical protein